MWYLLRFDNNHPVVLTTRPPCQPSLALCLSSLRESLPSVPDAYGQSLEALLSQPAVFRSESYVPGAMSKEEYPVTIVVSDEHGTKSRVHIPAYDGSEALKKHHLEIINQAQSLRHLETLPSCGFVISEPTCSYLS
ncbi:hypothetical protein Tco_0352753 [Tanacetum coccineum]